MPAAFLLGFTAFATFPKQLHPPAAEHSHPDARRQGAGVRAHPSDLPAPVSSQEFGAKRLFRGAKLLFRGATLSKAARASPGLGRLQCGHLRAAAPRRGGEQRIASLPPPPSQGICRDGRVISRDEIWLAQKNTTAGGEAPGSHRDRQEGRGGLKSPAPDPCHRRQPSRVIQFGNLSWKS